MNSEEVLHYVYEVLTFVQEVLLYFSKVQFYVQEVVVYKNSTPFEDEELLETLPQIEPVQSRGVEPRGFHRRSKPPQTRNCIKMVTPWGRGGCNNN